MVDYESAIHAAFQNHFKNIKIKGCQFHLYQCIIKKIKKMGLNRAYLHNRDNRIWFKKIMAISFIPPSLIDKAFNTLVKAKPAISGIDEFINYAKKTWFNENSLYSRHIWNHYKTICPTHK